MDRNRFVISLLLAFSLLFAGASLASAVVHPPDINPDNFDPAQAIDNPYFPQPVGTQFVYTGTKEGVATRDEICVTKNKRLIPGVGVWATVVHHRSFENNVLVEDTFDWFAQDKSRNVWYLGEDTTEFPSRSKEGSWEAGVDDADAGFIMLAQPQVNDRYYQEFARNVAEDQAKVVSLDESVRLTTGAQYKNVLVIQETSRLDPGVVEYKYYARNVGFILGVMRKGGDERTELVGTEKCNE